MAFRFVHTADIHLDSPLRSLALRDPELAELIGNATRRAFCNVVDLCLSERVDALLLAGDLYDGDQTSMKTARFLADQVGRLHEAGIRTFIIRGNHDALSRITKELVLPESVKLFGGRPDPALIGAREGGLSLAIHGISFAQPHAPASLLPKYRPVQDAVNIGLMHTSLDGSAEHDHYAPCKSTELHTAGFRYWGLGHIHKRAHTVAESIIVMPGMPQGRDINEAGAKSATLVTIGDDGAITLEERVTSVAQFERLRLDLTGIETWPDMVRRMEMLLHASRRQAPSEHLVIRLEVTGTTPLAWQLRRDADLLQAEAAHRALAAGKGWIEKIELTIRAPAGPPTYEGDPIAELRDLIARDVAGSAAFRAEAAAIAADLRAQLPPESRGSLGSDEAAFDSILDALLADGAEDVLARLQAGARQEDG